MAYEHFKDFGFGLVTEFIVPEHFAAKQKVNLEDMGMGYWKFDGFSIDCQGEFIRIDPDTQCSRKEKRLEKQWKTQQKEIENAKKERTENFCRVIHPPAPNQLFPDKAAEYDSKKAIIGHIGRHKSKDATHAMVLLGGCIEKDEKGMDKHYFMLLNSWEGMPLVLVSAGYLLACSCKVYFCTEMMSEEAADKWGEKHGQILCTYDVGDDGEDSSYLSPIVDGSH